MNAYSILLSVALTWMPTINGVRSNFGEYEPPYWLGISVPPQEEVMVEVYQLNELLFMWEQGTDWDLYYVTQYEPIYFYENGIQVGTIIPEPTTFMFITASLVFLRNQQRTKNKINSVISLN